VAYPTEAAMLKWTYDRAKRMARNPLYRGIMKAVGPSRLFRIGPKAHGLLQRGTELRNTIEPGRVISRVSYPHGLHDHWNSLSNVPALRALAELTGGRAVRARMLDHGDLHTTYECSWLED
jgi:hypothetical protein